DQKQKRGGLRADRDFLSIPVQMWEGACPRWRPLGWPGCRGHIRPCIQPAWFDGAPEIKIKSGSLRIVVTGGRYSVV
ncbi:hypothetical protein, partial [Pseudomonas sp.]|uniref:hypothetical protein n=1 Tax=Pseudomonas sp. TaxID=306 RepID=UPI0026DA892F